VRIAQSLCSEVGTTLANSVAFGDSVSDLFLFEKVGFSVAVNGTAAVRAKANFSYVGTDLLEAFENMLSRIASSHSHGDA
jgi:phosphoserine phosphatase